VHWQRITGGTAKESFGESEIARYTEGEENIGRRMEKEKESLLRSKLETAHNPETKENDRSN
jgi:hypothetical protein